MTILKSLAISYKFWLMLKSQFYGDHCTNHQETGSGGTLLVHKNMFSCGDTNMTI
jgi:hypothetical protein